MRFGAALLLLGLGVGGLFVAKELPERTQPATPAAESSGEQYVSFVINTQEFIYDELSADTINRILDIHETYDVPVDVYLDDAITQKYEADAPELLERLKTSDVAAVSYHIRPPKPYYAGFDWADLAGMDASDMYDLFMDYETHAVDAATGEPTEAAGGYGHLTDLMGYAPVVAAMQPNPESGPTLAKVFKDLGASYFIEHRESPIEPGEMKSGVPLRPETLEVRLFERTDETAEQLVKESFDAAREMVDGPTFVNIKVHDNDFIADASAWTSIYLAKGSHRTPPFDLSNGTDNRSLLTEAESTVIWDAYEASVAYVAEHRDEYTPINAFDLSDLPASGTSATGSGAPVVPTATTTVDGQPVIYVSVVTHNEEPASGRYPDFTKDEDAFWEHREAVIDFATMLKEEGATYDWMSDWTFLLAAQQFDRGTDETEGKNVVRYLAENLGVSVDPHAHQTRYSYADVAYLISQLGVTPTGVVGGFIVNPVSASILEDFWEPIKGRVYPEATWTATILWGGGSAGHTADTNASGVWRPASAENFTQHSDDAPLPNVGGYVSDWDGLDALLAAQAAGELTAGEIYTVSIMAGQDELTEAGYIEEFRDHIRDLRDETEDGRIVWMTVPDVLDVWVTSYESEPNVYLEGSEETESAGSGFGAGTPSGNACGDGVCSTFERKMNLCSEDC